MPGYETAALEGRRAPHRFGWRRRWYRVTEVAASWQDGRQRDAHSPEYGRLYFNVATEPRGLFQIYFERQTGSAKGRWVLYRQTEIRPVRRSDQPRAETNRREGR